MCNPHMCALFCPSLLDIIAVQWKSTFRQSLNVEYFCHLPKKSAKPAHDYEISTGVCSKVWLVLRGFTLTAVTLHTVQCSCMPHLSLTNILYFTVLGINSLAFVPVQLRDASICISPITASTADLNIEQTGSVGNRGLDEIRLIVKTRPLAP